MKTAQKRAAEPKQEFATAQDVLESPSLTNERKLEILEGWRADLIELQVAEAENMPSPGPDTGASAQRLAEVTSAIATLCGDAKPDQAE